MRRLAPLLIPLLVAVASADDMSASKSELTASEPAMIQQFGMPADAGAVRAVLQTLDRGDTDGAIRLAHALGRCGGPAAADGLASLVRHRCADVRVAALEAAAQVHLREPDLVERTRLALDSQDQDTARAACVAIGAIGDGSDIDALLDFLESEDVETRVAAFKALRALSGQRISPMPARWSYWWRTAHRRATEAVNQATAALDAEPDGPRAALHEALLVRSGWIELEAVDETIRRWLTSPDKVNRARACRLAAHFRLVARITEIRPLARFAFSGELETAVHEALVVLGAPEPPKAAR